MSVLSDNIERFIKELMQQSDEISLQRNELAQHFSCAPSQINYVLSTRFTLDHGYMTISRRGGGGYIRVLRVNTDSCSLLQDLLCNRIGDSLDKNEAHAIIVRIADNGLIGAREAKLMQATVDACTLPTQTMQNNMRARILRAMLAVLIQENPFGTEVE